jgi:endonuclease/exonuclease/phosphatase family metal-dependent hydrolase
VGVRLRVGTYNVLHGISLRTGRVDLGPAADLIARLDADVVAVQEVDRDLARSGGGDQVADLGRRTGLHATFGAALLGDPDDRWTPVPAVDPGGPAYGVGLLTRRPPAAVRRVALPGGGEGRREPVDPAGRTGPPNPGWDREPRAALLADLDLDGVRVRVATTHLSYLPWRAMGQLRAALAAAAAGADGVPAVLTGDLNLPALGVRGLVRGWRSAQGFATYPAWNPRLQPDQLLVRGPVRVLDVAVGPQGPSDHLPLVTTLELDVTVR